MTSIKRITVAKPVPRFSTKKLLIASAIASMFGVSGAAYGQTDEVDDDLGLEEVVVTGIRASLQNALDEKRQAANLKEVIIAEDIGKLPDQNLAEVLENITGIQITRTAGVGTNVQIRGTSANRVEINGVSTVGSGAGRSGIDFEDVNASIIAAVEVTKAPEAKTIEGSVGGTINLRTIRPLELTETLASVRVQFEDSSLSTESIQPRFSGAYGDSWVTDAGRFGFVVSGSYTEQEAVSFRPRADRDNLGGPNDDFLGIQFLLQEQENDDFETINLASSFEWAPNDNLTLFADFIFNDQERSRDQYRLQASGVGALLGSTIPTSFETVDFGNFGGQDLGTRQAALTGVLEPNLGIDDDDPNLRFTTETGSRVTESEIFRLGGNWQGERLSVGVEIASTSSDTSNPTLNTTLNFINPNCPLDGSSNDNCVPFVFDLSGESLAFGINFDSPFAPSVADLLNPANVVLDAAQVGNNISENEENAFRVDLSYAFAETGITSVDFGYRFNESSSRFEDIDDSFGFSQLEDSPNGLLFQELLVQGPTNFNDADGRDLFIQNFLLIDPDRSFSDQAGVIAILENALAENRLLNPQADGALTLDPESDQNAFFDVEEETNSLYVQANFEYGIVRGNFGARYIDTEVESIGFGPEDANGNRQLQSSTDSYDFFLPRVNVVIQPSEDVIVRLGYNEDIRRPDFDDLNTGFTFDTSENAVVSFGNVGLEPEEVESIDVAVEWYFAPAAVVSAGYFRKERTNLFTTDTNDALILTGSPFPGGQARETDPACPGGGIFNPDVIPNVLGDPNTLGLCVDFTLPGNDSATTTVDGIELGFQYDLSNFEGSLGWASGFGIALNATFQDFSGGSAIDDASGRGEVIFGSDIEAPEGLLDFSEESYNITLFYEKYGLSARARYTWREAFRTNDFGGGANESGSSTFGFPVVTDDRGQLNASISYDINENFNIGVEAVNLTEEEIIQNCVSGSGPLCFVGFPDRRIIFGGSYRF